MDQISTTAVEAAETASDRYIIDGRSSRFTVRAFATGLLAAMGHNPTIGIRDLSGEMNFDPEKLEAGSFPACHQGVFAERAGRHKRQRPP